MNVTFSQQHTPCLPTTEFFPLSLRRIFLLKDEEESLSDGSTASCPTGKRPAKNTSSAAGSSTTEHGFTTISSGVSVADYFARKMAALKQGNNLASKSSTNTSGVEKVRDSFNTVNDGLNPHY